MNTMKKMLLPVFAAFSLFGCAHNYYNVPKETFESKVRTLAVVPLFVDGSSDIRHPEKDAVVSIIRDFNRQNERELMRMLKETNTFFSVRFIEEDAERLYQSLVERGERRDDAGIVYNKYFLRREEVRRLVNENTVDALMVVVVSGITQRHKLSSSNLLSYLESDYNGLIMTAQIVDVDGNILWEYPNFRQRVVSFPRFYGLQYPDFDEAAANETDKVEVKFKTVAGVTRAFQKKEKDLLRRDLRTSRLYYAVFKDMVDLLEPSSALYGSKKAKTDAGGAAKVK